MVLFCTKSVADHCCSLAGASLLCGEVIATQVGHFLVNSGATSSPVKVALELYQLGVLFGASDDGVVYAGSLDKVRIFLGCCVGVSRSVFMIGVSVLHREALVLTNTQPEMTLFTPLILLSSFARWTGPVRPVVKVIKVSRILDCQNIK